jgi:hypothetical protein
VPTAHTTQHAIPPAQLGPAPFFFCARSLTGGARLSGPPPTSSRRGSRPLLHGRQPLHPILPLPAFKTPPSSAVKLPLHFPAINRLFPLLSPPLKSPSRPQAIDGHGRRGAASPPLPGLYKRP